MLAMPVATVSVRVLARSQLEMTKTLRPRDSGTQSAPYPQPSTRLAKSAAAAAVIAPIEAHTPSRPSGIALPPPVIGERAPARTRRGRCARDMVPLGRVLSWGPEEEAHGQDADRERDDLRRQRGGPVRRR